MGFLPSTPLSEEDAFWLLVAVQELAPFYYVKDMTGVQVATQVLSQLLQQRCPDVYEHFTRLDSMELYFVSCQAHSSALVSRKLHCYGMPRF